MKKIKIIRGPFTSEEIEVDRSLVIVGANGSGKTRLGSKIEQINGVSKRISAQRSLQLRHHVQKESLEQSNIELDQAYKNQNPSRNGLVALS